MSELRAHGGCGRKRIKAEPVEAHFEEMVLGMLADPTTRDVLVALHPDRIDGDVISIGEQVRSIGARRGRLRRQLALPRRDPLGACLCGGLRAVGTMVHGGDGGGRDG